jgi:glycosyltransferase involved in cell wall biosynthesis
MKILIANRHLKGLGGSETFTYTLIAELQRQGHDVQYFTMFRGVTSEKIEELGVKFANAVNYDLIIAGQMDTITELRKLKFTGPLVQICHGCLTPGEQPHPGADGYIAISREVQEHLKKKGIEAPVILNGIDCKRFRPTRKPGKTLKVIASMAQTDEANAVIHEAAGRVGARVIRLDKYQDKIWDVEKAINKADLVVSLGRGCYEAMACGRPVVIFDKRRYQEMMGDGYLFPAEFDNYIQANCSGRYSNTLRSVSDLVKEFECYNPLHGAELRKIALQQLNIEIQSKMILEYCQVFIDKYHYPGAVDVVYVLGKGSNWADNEIRYSIRSFKKHFTDLRNIVIVGERPVWLRGVIHIPVPDDMNVNKDARMLMKLAAACKDPRVSKRFIFCTDDTFLNKDLSFSAFTGWHCGPMMYDAQKDLEDHRSVGEKRTILKPSDWFSWVYATGYELKKRGLPDNNYDRSHCPQPVDKKEFLSILAQWDIVNNHYTCSNLYLNSSSVFKGEDIRGRNGKIYNPMTRESLREYLADKIVFNVNDRGLTEIVKNELQLLFPEPSVYELFYTSTDKRKAVETWFKNGCDYDEGLAIVTQFAPKNINLRRFLEKKKGQEIAQFKLQQTLKLWLR